MQEKKGKKKAIKVLEKWPFPQETNTKGLRKGKPMKRLKEAPHRKEGSTPERKGGMRQSLLENWIRKEKGGFEANLGPRKDKKEPTDEPEPT